MRNIKILVTITLVFFLASNLIAQVENTIKETKVKVEKQVDKASEKVSDVKIMVNSKTDKIKKACDTDGNKACCSAEVKEIKAEVKKHGADCKCEGCSTASASVKKGEKMMKHAHAADCEGCNVAHAKMKKHEHKAHSTDCSCEGCAKT